MKYILTIFAITVLVGCGTEQAQQVIKKEIKDNKELSSNEPELPLDTSFYELNDNIAVTIIFNPSDYLMQLTISNKEKSKWEEVQKFDSLICHMVFGQFDLSDYNGDGIDDLSVLYGTPARGSNEFHHLFIKEKDRNKFNYIKGSAGVPNLQYNKAKDVLTATAFHGTADFYEYKIVADSLIVLSRTHTSTTQDEQWTTRDYYEYDEKGIESFIKRDSVNDKGRGIFSYE